MWYHHGHMFKAGPEASFLARRIIYPLLATAPTITHSSFCILEYTVYSIHDESSEAWSHEQQGAVCRRPHTRNVDRHVVVTSVTACPHSRVSCIQQQLRWQLLPEATASWPELDRPFEFARVTPWNAPSIVDFAGANPWQSNTKY